MSSKALGLLLLSTLAGCDPGDSGARLYVTSGFTDEILVMDARDGRIRTRLSLDRRPGERDEPHGVAVSPDGRHWYATLAHGEPTLWKYETAGDRLVGRLTLPLPGAARVAVSPDGRHGVVTDYWLGGLGRVSRLAVVALEDLSLVEAPLVCPAPHHAAWSPDGGRIAVTCSLGDELAILDADDLEVVRRFPVFSDGAPASAAGNPRGKPLNLAWSPDGSRLYASLIRAGLVVAFSADGRRLWAAPVGDGPAQVALTPDGATLVVANRGDGTLALVDTGKGEAHRIHLEGAPHPHGVALDEEGRIAYVTYEGTTRSRGGVLAVDLSEEEVLWQVEAGVYTLGVAYLG